MIWNGCQLLLRREIGDVRSGRAWLVLQLFNINNRFLQLINGFGVILISTLVNIYHTCLCLTRQTGNYPRPHDYIVKFGAEQTFMIIGVSLLLLISCFLILKYTKIGWAMRAVAKKKFGVKP